MSHSHPPKKISGELSDLETEINLSDHRPAQKKYISVPGPLHPEMKQYIEDLLNQNFITESNSPYSSPVVCVHKKDGTLRLCIDCRELNRTTVADRHPIPIPRNHGQSGWKHLSSAKEAASAWSEVEASKM